MTFCQKTANICSWGWQLIKEESVIKASSPALLKQLILVICAKEALLQEQQPEWSQEFVITPQNSIITLWASLPHQQGAEPVDHSFLSKHRPTQQAHTEENHRQLKGRNKVKSAQTRPKFQQNLSTFFKFLFFLSYPLAPQPFLYSPKMQTST